MPYIFKALRLNALFDVKCAQPQRNLRGQGPGSLRHPSSMVLLAHHCQEKCHLSTDYLREYNLEQQHLESEGTPVESRSLGHLPMCTVRVPYATHPKR